MPSASLRRRSGTPSGDSDREREADREGYSGPGFRLLAVASGFVLQWRACLYRLAEF